MVICGQEFEFSALNANDVERVETAQRRMEAASDREKQRPHTGMADILRGQCRLLMNYLDEVLGEGASQRLGLDGSDFGACASVMNAFKEACTAEQEIVKQAAALPMNREQRRAQSKKNRHQKPVSRSDGFDPKMMNRPVQPAALPYEQWGTMTPHDAAELSEIDKAERRKALLGQLAALENG